MRIYIRISTLGLLLTVLGGVAVAQETRTYENLSVTDGPVAISAATLQPTGQAPVTRCAGRVETAQIRVADSRAVTVASATGRVLEVGDTLELSAPDLSSVRFAKTGSTTGVLILECGR